MLDTRVQKNIIKHATHKWSYLDIFNHNFQHPIGTVIAKHHQQKSCITDRQHSIIKQTHIVFTVMIHTINIIPISAPHNARCKMSIRFTYCTILFCMASMYSMSASLPLFCLKCGIFPATPSNNVDCLEFILTSHWIPHMHQLTFKT